MQHGLEIVTRNGALELTVGTKRFICIGENQQNQRCFSVSYLHQITVLSGQTCAILNFYFKSVSLATGKCCQDTSFCFYRVSQRKLYGVLLLNKSEVAALQVRKLAACNEETVLCVQHWVPVSSLWQSS